LVRRRIIDVADTYDSAKQTREIFQGKPVRKVDRKPFSWPHFVRYLGRTNAENYFSDKMLSGGKWEFYKHIAEGPQYLFINDEITSMVNDEGDHIVVREASRGMRPNRRSSSIPREFQARSFEITGTMPAHLADLAPSKGVQWVAPNRRYYEARIPHSMLAAAKHPHTGETILVVYSREGMHFLITGPELDVTKDGIVG
jgi:hypothetical protein